MRLSVLIASATAIAAVAAPLHAQSASATALQLTPYAGYMIFGNFLNGPLGTSVSNAPGLMYGTQIGLRIAPNVSLIGNVAESNSNLQIGVPFLGGVNVGSSQVTMYDAGLEFDLPRSAQAGLPLNLFLQAGAGGMHYAISDSYVNTKATNFAGNFGGGADVTLGRGLALRLMAKDYVGKFNFQDATGFNINGNTTHNWALNAGLRFDF